MPGGLFATRRAIRRRGGLIAIAIAISLWLLGVVVKFVFSGSIGGGVSFICMVMALPVMPLLGMPATGGSSRLLVAIALSGAMCCLLGQVVAARVTQRPVVGWREWTRGFVVMGSGLWVGAAGVLLLGAFLLGAF